MLDHSHNQIWSEADFFQLKELVNQNSQSQNNAGVAIIQNSYSSLLENLGFSSSFISNPTHESSSLLIAKRKGETDFTISTIGHADTVLGPQSAKFEIIGNKIFGAGIADNKSGQMIAIKGIEYYLRNCEKPKITIQFISSPNEELGSLGFHEIFNEISTKTDMAIGFEPALGDGSLIESRNGNKWFDLKLKGSSYHSGRAPKGHMNIAHDLCRLITKLDDELMEYDDITMNIGKVSGGNSVNTICGDISASIDTRFSNFEGVEVIDSLINESLTQNFKKCSRTGKNGELEVAVTDFCPPMSANIESAYYLNLYKEVLSKLTGEEAKSVHCGGAADVNHLSHRESVCFDGMGAVGDNMHRKDEFIYVESLEIKSKAFGEFLLKVDSQL